MRSTTTRPARLTPTRRAALQRVADGGVAIYELRVGRRRVLTPDGTRITLKMLEWLEGAGLVTRDTSHGFFAGQPVQITDAGRAALAGS